MLRRTRWRVVQEVCRREEARTRWEEARARGSIGAVTSWGSGIQGRQTLRTYWEAHEGAQLPEGEDLVEENWTPFWRDTLQVVRVTERITLVPAWTDPPEGVEFPIRIDPGMAFGAGDHPTTRLCLHILEDLAVGGRLPARMLDVGTGTGVLSLAAGFLGAEQVHALDIDPFGYAACRRNARLNGLEGSVHP
jgi:ribosomal protein L11 methyltransferase